MTSVALIPGAGGLGWYWHLVERNLQDRGYDAFAVDLAALGRTGLPAYADAVVDAIDGRRDVALVAQSMGAFTAPLVWQRVSTRLVVFVNAMIPQPGETPGEWWDNVGSEQARTAMAVREGYDTEFDLTTYFMHDVPQDLAGLDDRFFPLELQQRVARKRLGIDPVIVPGGHLAALSHPAELAAVIAGFLGPPEANCGRRRRDVQSAPRTTAAAEIAPH